MAIARLFFKTPDVLDQCLLDDEKKEDKELLDLIKRFVEYGECITVEFNTDTNTATVIEK